MNEKPIFMSPVEIKALLNGAKTQVRRIITGSTEFKGPYSSAYIEMHKGESGWSKICPYGAPGDRLWVRESWAEAHYWTTDEEAEAPLYKSADSKTPIKPVRWRSPATMTRWASRILLEIVSVRVARLSDISEAEAVAEGFDNSRSDAAIAVGWHEKPRAAYKRFWGHIHGAESWVANPWVWVVEFKLVEKG